MHIKDYMSKEVVTANLRDGLRQTFYRMVERKVRHMPVLNEEEQVVGIISDRDLRRPDWVDSEENVAHYYLLDNEVKVEQAMSADPVVVKAGDDIRVALEVFLNRRYGALPVVDEDNKAIGILSAFDVLRAFNDSLHTK
jgi:acetoin utilization protein AcuB